MNRNQKIAIGCGAAGCLGLIVLVIVGCVLFFVLRSPSRNSNRNRNFGQEVPSNANSNSNSATNSNESESSESSSSSSMSDDDKHKLFQAGAATQDTEIVHRVWRKLGLMDAAGTPNDQYAEFVKDHVVWLFRNADFAKSLDTPEKARAYVEAHIDD